MTAAREPATPDAVLLLGFGGPEGPEDVLPFLRNVSRGRNIPDERLLEVGTHYRALGGRSPINDLHRDLAVAMADRLRAGGLEVPVLLGNRNWHPYLADVLGQVQADGHRRVTAVLTAAYSSFSSCRQYRNDVEAALAGLAAAGATPQADGLEVNVVPPYFTMAGFVDPFVDGTERAVREVIDLGIPNPTLLFTTHSIPRAMSSHSGPPRAGTPVTDAGDVYVRQHLAVATHIMDCVHARLGADGPPLPWRLVYQSRSGPPHQPWLEPDIGDVIDELPAGAGGVVVVPIGFIADHVEVIWDLDTVAQGRARARGLAFARVPTPCADPRFAAGLAERVIARVRQSPAEGPGADLHLDPWRGLPDPCPVGCCASGARPGSQPATTRPAQPQEGTP